MFSVKSIVLLALTCVIVLITERSSAVRLPRRYNRLIELTRIPIVFDLKVNIEPIASGQEKVVSFVKLFDHFTLLRNLGVDFNVGRLLSYTRSANDRIPNEYDVNHIISESADRGYSSDFFMYAANVTLNEKDDMAFISVLNTEPLLMSTKDLNKEVEVHTLSLKVKDVHRFSKKLKKHEYSIPNNRVVTHNETSYHVLGRAPFPDSLGHKSGSLFKFVISLNEESPYILESYSAGSVKLPQGEYRTGSLSQHWGFMITNSFYNKTPLGFMLLSYVYVSSITPFNILPIRIYDDVFENIRASTKIHTHSTGLHTAFCDALSDIELEYGTTTYYIRLNNHVVGDLVGRKICVIPLLSTKKTFIVVGTDFLETYRTEYLPSAAHLTLIEE